MDGALFDSTDMDGANSGDSGRQVLWLSVVAYRGPLDTTERLNSCNTLLQF